MSELNTASTGLDKVKHTLVENKKASLIVGACAIAVLGGGWAYASHKATAIARDLIDGFLIRHHLADTVSYGGLSASPFGSVSLSDVKIKPDPNVVVTIKSVDVSDVDVANDIPRAFNITIDDANIPLLAIARGTRDRGYAKAIGYGFGELHTSGKVAFHYSTDTRRMTFKSSIDVRDAGSWDMSLALDDVSPGLFQATSALSNAAANNNSLAALFEGSLTGLQVSLSQISLAEASMSIDTSKISKRLKEIPDTDIPTDDDAALHGAFKVDETKLVEQGMAPSAAHALGSKLQSFANQGGRLKIASNLDRPVPLFRDGNLFMPAFSNLVEFLTVTKSTFSN